jgi:hypothetical protein
LPGWVIWTAHEKVAENKVTGEKVIGPEGAGGAQTPVMQRMFGNTLHFVVAEKIGKELDDHTGAQVNDIEMAYRIYFKHHSKPEGKMFTKYLATARIDHPELLPESGYLESNKPGESIMKFYETVAKSKQLSLESIMSMAQAKKETV